MTLSDNLWRNYVAQLGAAMGIRDANLFKVDTGLSAADWAVLDTTGLPPKPKLGQSIAANVFARSDPMPRWAPASYERGNGFHDMYAAFLDNLKPSAAASKAQTQAKQYMMSDPPMGKTPAGPEFPAYSITPDLGDWYTNALQTLAGGQAPQLNFTVTAGSSPREGLGATLGNSQVKLGADAPGEAGVKMPFFGSVDIVAPVISGPRDFRSTAPTIIESAPELTLTYTAQALAVFSVAAGAWYNSSMLAIYWDQIKPGSPLANKPLFGEDGLLNLTVGTIIVALQRSVTISGPAAQLDSLQAVHFTPGPGQTVVGGFSFDRDPAQTTAAAGNDAFVLKDNGNIPYVIGLGTNLLG